MSAGHFSSEQATLTLKTQTMLYLNKLFPFASNCWKSCWCQSYRTRRQVSTLQNLWKPLTLRSPRPMLAFGLHPREWGESSGLSSVLGSICEKKTVNNSQQHRQCQHHCVIVRLKITPMHCVGNTWPWQNDRVYLQSVTHLSSKHSEKMRVGGSLHQTCLQIFQWGCRGLQAWNGQELVQLAESVTSGDHSNLDEDHQTGGPAVCT